MREEKRGEEVNVSIPILLLGSLALAVSGCAGSGKSKGRAATARGDRASDSKLESRAAVAVEATTQDEKMAPKIQAEVNALFFGSKKERPGGLDAFSSERIIELESEIEASTQPSLVYYRANKEYFERLEDPGGGFRVSANGRRLVPFLKTETGRRKLFAMDTARVREMVRNPCFAVVEDCGEYASDGEENTALLDAWSRKYPEKEFRSEREKLLEGYLASLKKYRAKFERRLKNADPRLKATIRAQQAVELVGTHIKGVETLLP